MLEETAEEGGQPFLDNCFVVYSTESNVGQMEYLAWAISEAEEVVDEKIMQFVGWQQTPPTGEMLKSPEIPQHQQDKLWGAIVRNYAQKHPEIFSDEDKATSNKAT